MTTPLSLSREVARRFVLGKQGLWPGRRWTGKEGTAAAARACEHLQLDPVQVVGRSHDLVLHARVHGYDPRDFDVLAYEERQFFDWGGWLAVRPMNELPCWRVLMRRERQQPRIEAMAQQHGAAIDEMRQLLRDRPTLSGRDFERGSRTVVRHYRGSKDSSVALHYLWRTGEAMTHHREGFERVYALAESVAPAALLIEADEAEAERYLALKDIRFAGIGRLRPLSGTFLRKVVPPEDAAIEAGLLRNGQLIPVLVDGWRGARFIAGEDLPLLEEVARGCVPGEWSPLPDMGEREVTFLSPLDPVCARGRARELFGFDYAWEIYKRSDQVKFGRYTMPVLFGDELVGRIDFRTDRRLRTLVINGAWLEDDGPGDDVAFLAALARGLTRFMAFLGVEHLQAETVTLPAMRRYLRERFPAPP